MALIDHLKSLRGNGLFDDIVLLLDLTLVHNDSLLNVSSSSASCGPNQAQNGKAFSSLASAPFSSSSSLTTSSHPSASSSNAPSASSSLTSSTSDLAVNLSTSGIGSHASGSSITSLTSGVAPAESRAAQPRSSTLKSTVDALNLTPQTHLQCLLYYGDALFHIKDYRKAEKVFQKALALRKTGVKSAAPGKRKSASLSNVHAIPELSTENDIKYHIALCHDCLAQWEAAINILETIPEKQRTIKTNLFLGDLFLKDSAQKSAKSAIKSYKEVLRSSPFSLHVIVTLIKLQMKPAEILAEIKDEIDRNQYMSWVPQWVEAQGLLYSSRVEQSIPVFKQLLQIPHLKDNFELKISLAQAYYYSGNYKKAIAVFRRIFASDSLNQVKGADFYAACMYKENQVKELESFANKISHRCDGGNEASPEPWIVLSYYCLMANKKDTKALYFCQKACILSNNSIEALLLKGTIIAETKSASEAIGYYAEAHNNASYRYETIKCLADAYVNDNRKQMALQMTQHAFKEFGENPKTLTLAAQVNLSETVSKAQKALAKQQLEKAVRLDPGYLPAVFMLYTIYNEEKAHDKNLAILTKAVEIESNTKLHRLLGELYMERNEQDKALHHHNIANKIEMNLRSCTEASQRLEHQVQVSQSDNIESTLELEVDDVQSEGDVDESETDVVWSDADFDN